MITFCKSCLRLALVILLAAFLTGVVANRANANASNQVMKACLEEYGYTPDKFLSFDFSKPAACHSKWRVAETSKQLAKMRQFLEEHPWYRGENWQWEECSKDNRCTKRFTWWSTKEN